MSINIKVCKLCIICKLKNLCKLCLMINKNILQKKTSKDFPKFRSGKAKSNLSQESYLFFGLNVNVFLVISKIWCILIQKVFKMAFAPLKISGENDANKTFTVCKQIMRNISKCCKLFLVDSTFILILELIIWIHNNENILFRVSKEGMTQQNEPFLLFLAWENWASKEDWK